MPLGGQAVTPGQGASVVRVMSFTPTPDDEQNQDGAQSSRTVVCARQGTYCAVTVL